VPRGKGGTRARAGGATAVKAPARSARARAAAKAS
jgi:hypothetical protein